MREIKFQAWLRDEKQMVNVIKINTFDKYIQYYDMVEVIGNVFEHPELLEVEEAEKK